MKVILLEKISKYGNINDVVDVPAGYAMNFLVLNKKAVIANKENLQKIALEQQKQVKNNKQQTQTAQKHKKEIEKLNLIFEIHSFKDKVAHYVTVKNIIQSLRTNVKLTKKNFSKFQPIKKLGTSYIEIKLYKNVIARCKITVLPKKNK